MIFSLVANGWYVTNEWYVTQNRIYLFHFNDRVEKFFTEIAKDLDI